MVEYQKLLVALDGSERAGEALPHAIAIASLSGAALTLLRVVHSIEQLERDPGTLPVEGQVEYSQAGLAERRQEDELLEAREYLDRMRQSLVAQGLTVETKIRRGEPSTEILAEAQSGGVDMILLTAYGLGGAHILREQAVFGSVADAVLRRSRIPVLVIRPT